MNDRSKVYFYEGLIRKALFLCAFITVLVTFSIVFILFSESKAFFSYVSLSDFLFGTEWTPLFEPRKFGVLPILGGTLLIAVLSIILAFPVGIAIAIYLSQYASSKTRNLFKPILELIAGIPSVVYGYLALVTISPIVQSVFPGASIFNALNATIVVAIMILPMIASISDDSLKALPRSLADSGYATGATKFEVIRYLLLPSAASGIFASVLLAFSRAIGETMAVTLAAGATPNLTINPLESVQTMTAYIVQVSLGDVTHGSVQYNSIFAVALLLFFITLIINMISNLVLRSLKVKYDEI